MYTLFRLLPVKRLAFQQAPALMLAGLIAEWFYKFHSFTLECIAFLATWFLFDAVIEWISRRSAYPLAPTLRLRMQRRQLFQVFHHLGIDRIVNKERKATHEPVTKA